MSGEAYRVGLFCAGRGEFGDDDGACSLEPFTSDIDELLMGKGDHRAKFTANGAAGEAVRAPTRLGDCAR